MGEFLDNLLRYLRYLIAVILGVLVSFLQRFGPLLKNPVTAVATVGLFVGAFAFLVFTLRAMLGLS